MVQYFDFGKCTHTCCPGPFSQQPAEVGSASAVVVFTVNLRKQAGELGLPSVTVVMPKVAVTHDFFNCKLKLCWPLTC